MKSKFLTFLLCIIMLFLVVGIGIIGIAIYSDFMDTNPENIIYKIENTIAEIPENVNKITNSEKITEANLTIANTAKNDDNTFNTNELNNRFFYNQLNDEQKTIYDGLQNNKDNLKQGNYIIQYGDIFPNSDTQEEGNNKLEKDYQTAIEAFVHDNSDLFYLDVNKMYLNIETTTKLFRTTHNIYISSASGDTYLSDDFKSTEQIELAITQINQIKDDILRRLTGSDYQNISYIHDYLVDNVKYDTTYNAIGTHSIYGALVGKSCVCEGYMKAFKYLTNAAGYECEMMQGTATNSSQNTESHAWNCINYNGTWYEVDVTWDDPIIIGNGTLSNSARYKYFLKGRTTFEKDHMASYQFSENGKIFSYPTISTKDY